jgi:predicted porin
MKKTLLAAALLAGFAAAAQAETQVTLRGLIDGGLMYSKVSGGHSRFGPANGIQNGNRFILTGTEDLGGDLQAIFWLEQGFNISNGSVADVNRSAFNRTAYMGLQGKDWGVLRFGRQVNFTEKFVAAVNPFGNSFTGGVGGTIGHSVGAADTDRTDNFFQYETPVISGFKAGIGYSFNHNDYGATTNRGAGPSDKTRVISAGISYSNGPLYAAFAYEQTNPSRSCPAEFDIDDFLDGVSAGVLSIPAPLMEGCGNRKGTPRSYSLGLSYDFEVVKLGLAYSHVSDASGLGGSLGGGVQASGASNWNSHAGVDGVSSNGYMLGVTVPLSKSTKVMASWQMLNPSGYVVAGISGGGAANGDATMQSFGLGISHDLSKRTSIYSIAGYVRNWGFRDDRNAKSLGVGLKHMF